MTANLNRKSNTPPLTDLSVYLPYPSAWRRRTAKKMDIRRETAIEFLRTYKKLPVEIEYLFEPILDTIKAVADSL